MILFLVYTGAGIYMLLMVAGLIHKPFMSAKDPHTRSNMRLSMSLFGAGMILLGSYYGYIYLLLKPTIQQVEQQHIEKLEEIHKQKENVPGAP